MTVEELRRLVESAVTVDVETAGRAYGIGRAKAYALARAGQFPVPVLTVGSRHRVRTADLAADLLPRTNEAGPSATEEPAPMTTSTGEQIGSHFDGTPHRAA